MDEINLMDFTSKIYSQHGQDGVLLKIFELIGATNKYFVEFGSSGSKEGQGNTIKLRDLGFDGILMDGSDKPYSELIKRDFPVNIEFITAENISSLFKKYAVPYEFDFLSIDIDGQDFHVWNNLDTLYKPRVVSIETNYEMNPEIDVVQEYNISYIWNGTSKNGSSILALMKLGNSKGYDLVAYTGADAIFIRRDIILEKQLKIQFMNNVEALWHSNFQQGTLPKSPHLQHLFQDTAFFKPSSYYITKN